MGHKVKQSLVNSRVDFFYYAFRNILLVSIPLLVISGVVLSHLSFHSSATGSTSGSDNLTITISSSCTLSSVVNIPHNAEVYNGNYLGDIGKTTITTLCNDGNGYSVYVVGYSNNEEGNNKLINSEYPQYSIDTGLATSGLTSAWAMKLNNIPDDPSPTPPTIESDYNNVYGIVPLYWTKVASRTSGTTDMAQGSSFTTTYAVYASSSQYAGTYQGQVKYLLTHPAYPPAFRYMQDIANWKNELITEQSVQAIDVRDGKQYWVTKLKDGNIWMTQNLDLDIVAGSTNLTSNNTDLSTDENIYTASNTIYALKGTGDSYGYTYENGIATWIPERSTIPYGQLNKTNWQNITTRPYSYDGGKTYPDTNVTEANTGTHGLSGNYYNWTAAVASNNSNSVPGDVANSICPKGWKLPTINDFNIMLSTYDIISLNNTSAYLDGGFEKIISSPIHFIRAGGIINGESFRLNISGYYWTPHANSVNSSNYYSFYESAPNSNPTYCGIGRDCGRSIRCIAR